MSVKILADVNICLDLLLDRKPFVNFSGRIFEMAEEEEIILFISGLSFDTLFYVMRPAIGKKKTMEKLWLLHSYTSVGIVDSFVVKKALQSGWKDLEDALQYYCALRSECKYLVTRNVQDFRRDTDQIKILKPEEFLML
ncbi:MAG TPA: PIN domain-containing protein [Balneolaceae bacterium]|nr:PIN domain-containing protein [Balneolaceae bacterium]